MTVPLERRSEFERVAWVLVRLHELALSIGWRFDADRWCWVRADGSIWMPGSVSSECFPGNMTFRDRGAPGAPVRVAGKIGPDAPPIDIGDQA